MNTPLPVAVEPRLRAAAAWPLIAPILPPDGRPLDRVSSDGALPPSPLPPLRRGVALTLVPLEAGAARPGDAELPLVLVRPPPPLAAWPLEAGALRPLLDDEPPSVERRCAASLPAEKAASATTMRNGAPRLMCATPVSSAFLL